VTTNLIWKYYDKGQEKSFLWLSLPSVSMLGRCKIPWIALQSN
jgi:hypothetical protein